MIDFHSQLSIIPQVYETATLQDNLEHSGGLNISWNAASSVEIPMGSKIAYEGIKYILLEPYAPTKASAVHWRYEPQFKHPANLLDRIPFWIKSRTASGTVINLRTTSFTGYPHTICQKLADFFAEYLTETGDTFFQDAIGTNWTTNIEEVLNPKAIITVPFDGCTIKGAANAIANALGCNVFFDWNLDSNGKRTIRFISGTTIEGDVCNCYQVLGGTTNMGKVAVNGGFSAVTQRLTLDPTNYPGSIIDHSAAGGIRLITDIILDDIYPKMELYISSARQRLCYMTDEKGDKIETNALDPDGYQPTGDTKYYKIFAKWYIKLAVDRELTTPYAFDRSKLINDKALTMLFQIDYDGGNMSPLVGRQFELVYFDAITPEWEENDVLPRETPFSADATEYRIAFVAEGETILPGVGSPLNNPSTGMIPEVGNKVTLVNMALGDAETAVARAELLVAATEIIGVMETPKGDYTETMLSNVPAIGTVSPFASEGHNGVVVNVNKDVDTGVAEVTVGSWKMKGLVSGVVDKIDAVSVSSTDATKGDGEEDNQKLSSDEYDTFDKTKSKPYAKTGIQENRYKQTASETAPQIGDPDTWSTTAPNHVDGQYIWMIYATKYLNGTYSEWQGPIRLTGDTGSAGEDGSDMEYIYILKQDAYTFPSAELPANITTGEVSPGSHAAAGSETDKQLDDWVPNGWWDNPRGIDSTNKFEYMSWRHKPAGSNTWGAFSEPIVWSHFGRNGMDGDGVEYAFIRTQANVAPVIYDDEHYADSNTKTYTSDEHLPRVNGSGRTDIEANGGTSAYPECTDDPKGTNGTWKYEWVIKRTKGSPNADTGIREWEYYQGTMAEWSNYSESVFIIDLDNENDQFGTDSGSTVVTQQERSTGVTILYGSQAQALTNLTAQLFYASDGEEQNPISDTSIATVSCSIDQRDTTKGEVTVTIKNNAVISDTGLFAKITGTCAKGSKTTYFNLGKVKSGASGVSPTIYQLNLSQKSLSYGRDANNDLTAKSNSVKVNLKVTIGSTSTIYESAASIPSGLTKPTYSWGFDNSSTAEYSGLAIGTTIIVNPTNVGTHTKIWVLLTTGDKEEIPITVDGENGAEGDDGSYYIDQYGRASGRVLSSGTPSGFDSTTSWVSAAPEATTTYPYIWKRSRLWNPNTGDWATGSSWAYVCETGKSVAVAIASPSQITVPCNADGSVAASTSSVIEFSLKVGDETIRYSGTDAGRISSVTYSSLPTGVTSSYVAPDVFNARNVTVLITATQSGIASGVTFTVTGKTADGVTYSADVNVALIGTKQGGQGDSVFTPQVFSLSDSNLPSKTTEITTDTKDFGNGWNKDIPPMASLEAVQAVNGEAWAESTNSSYPASSGWRESKNNQNSARVVEKLTFRTTAANQSVVLSLATTMTELSWDGVLVSTTGYSESVNDVPTRSTKGSGSKDVTLTFAEAGTHTIYVVSMRDGSGGEVGAGYYKITSGLYLDGIIYCSMATVKNGTVQGSWSSPSRWNGVDGATGDDAFVIMPSMSSISLSQKLTPSSSTQSQYSTDFGLPMDITFTAKCGDSPATVDSVTNVHYTGVYATASGTTLTISSVIKSSANFYPTSGSITATVNASFNSRTFSQTFVFPVAITWQGRIVVMLGDTGIDIEHGKITSVGDKFKWQNTDGEIILGLDDEGNAEFAGVVKAKEFYHRTCAVSSGSYYPETYQYVGNVAASYGTIFDWSEIASDADLLERFTDYSSEFVMCTGKADVVNYVSYNTDGILMLPDPKECVGKIIDVFSCHLGNHQTPIAQDTYQAKNAGNRLMVTQLKVFNESGHADRLWFEDNNYTYQKTCTFGVPMKFQAVEMQQTHGGTKTYAWWCITGQHMITQNEFDYMADIYHNVT